ncbi:MAG: hypothetical protein OIN88_03145 [Candidatus Methanoperedens sp.]|nr:hypothetical protein [Candidatus Methanoperedens sp.]MCZ7359371.1 hypothetical protein [Candidatus Methanoperedens sp.]HLB70039.1 hypothetical protein [Candidatus Methanoperedens sp.]
MTIYMMFIGVILGLLLIPPFLVFASVSAEGARILAKELQKLLHRGERFLLISISKESIVLEPQVR